MFYDRFLQLCEAKNVSRTKACIDCGISRTAWRRWTDGGAPLGAALSKLAEYFEVSVDYLLGTEKEKSPSETGNCTPLQLETIELIKTLSPDEAARYYQIGIVMFGDRVNDKK